MKPHSAIETDLFAFDHRRKKIDALGDPLAEIESYIDFAALAAHGRSAEAEHREILRAALCQPSRRSFPPRQNSCHLDRILNSGAMMRERVGAIRTRIQRQSGGAVAAAGERNGGVGCA